MSTSVYYSGGPNINDIFDASTKANVIIGIKNKLVAAGWSLVDTTVEYNGAAGYKLASKLSPEGGQAEVYLSDIGLATPFTGFPQILIYTRDYPQTLTGASSVLTTFTGNYRIIANPYQYFIFPGYDSSTYPFVAMGGLLLGSGDGYKAIWSSAESTYAPGTQYLNHTFREELTPQSKASFYSINGTSIFGIDSGNNNASNNIQLLTLLGDYLVINDPDLHRGNGFMNGMFPVIQPLLCLGSDNRPGNMAIRGRISDAFVACNDFTAGTIQFHDGAYYECFTKSYKLGSLWLMLGDRATSSITAGRSY